MATPKVVLSLICCLNIVSAQTNLVNNPSFEIYSQCPDNYSQISFADGWFMPTIGTSDFFHACTSPTVDMNWPYPEYQFGQKIPHSGSGMGGFFINDMRHPSAYCYREYLATRLSAPLTANTKYYVTFCIKLADSCAYAGSAGMFFSTDSLTDSTYNPLPVTPQLQTSLVKNKGTWTIVSRFFTASGGEKFLYIGSFKPTTTIDTVFVGPGDRQTHMLRAIYYFVDDICVSSTEGYCLQLVGLPEKEKPLASVSPNPVGNTLRLVSANDEKIREVKIYGLDGSVRDFFEEVNSSKCQLDVKGLNQGIYFAEIKFESHTGFVRFVRE